MPHNAPNPPSHTERVANARRHVVKCTLVAMATGAIPVPASSVAIVAENAAMIAAVAVAMGVPVTVASVAESLGIVGAINMIGRTVFIEAARAIGWFGGPLGVAGVSALGASTAGLQTWTLGYLAIAIAENGGDMLSQDKTEQVLRESRDAYDAWRREQPADRHAS